jgi:hypothetical protein
MAWLRSRLRASSWVALFAIAMQLALSFGHVHLDRISTSSDPQSAHVADTSLAVTARAADELPAGANDECAVCALIALANSSILPLPNSLPVPMRSALVQHEAAPGFYVTQTTLLPFQARAPPVV